MMLKKTAQLSEKTIVKLICSYLNLKKCFIFIHDSVGIFDKSTNKFRSNRNPYRMRGVSDILGIWQGKFLAIEVKSKTGKVSEYQTRFLELVRQHGGIAFVARGIEDVEKNLALYSPEHPTNNQDDKGDTHGRDYV